jgi:hypothetical protein
MAEKITIEFGGERIEIPEFAMDSTVKTLEKVLRQQGRSADKSSANLKKSIETLMKELVGINAKQRQQKEIKAQKDTTEAVKNVGKKIAESSKAQKGLLSKLGGGSGSILGGVVSKFGKFGKMLNPITAGLFGLFNAVKAVTGFLMKMGRLENTLFRRGFNFIDQDPRLADGIPAFAAQAADAALSLDEAVELTSQFATAMGEYGTKTIFKAVENTQALLKEQGYLGLSANELAQGVAEMAEQFRGLGFDIEGNSTFLANQTVKVLQVTQAFTKLTNTSNDVIRQMVMQATAMEAFRNAMQMLPQGARAGATEASQLAFAGLGAFGEELGSQLTQALSEGIGRGGLQFTDFGQQLAGVSPLLLNSLQELRDAAGRGDSSGVVGALELFRTGILDVSNNQREFLRALEISGDPMAKFVLKLANMNETIDDADFRELAESMTSVSSQNLGVAQTQLALAMAKVREAFQKLQVAFLTEDVVRAFKRGIDIAVTALEGFAELVGKNAFNYLNQLVDAFARAGKWLKNMVSGSGIGDAITHITNHAVRTIGVAANRIIAETLPFGDSRSELQKMDALNAKVREAKTKDEYDKAINDLYEYVFKTATTFGYESSAIDMGDIKGTKYDTTAKKSERLNSRLGKYGVDTTFGASTQFPNYAPPGTDSGTGMGQDSTNMLGTQPRRRISIMPMYGNLDDYVGADQSPEMKQLIRINKNLEAQLEEARKGNEISDKISNLTQTQRDALRAMQTDNAYSVD